MRLGLAMDDLVRLDEATGRGLRAGLRHGLPDGLEILDAGSARLRVGLTGPHGVALAARRVWVTSAGAATRWEEALTRYEAALGEAGLSVLPAGIQVVVPPERGRVVWVIRPRVPQQAELSEAVSRATPETARRIARALRDMAQAAEAAGVPVPTDPSAWAWLDGELVLTHADGPPGLSAAERHGPWRFWAAPLRLGWFRAGAPLSARAADILRDLLAALLALPAAEGLVPALLSHLEPPEAALRLASRLLDVPLPPPASPEADTGDPILAHDPLLEELGLAPTTPEPPPVPAALVRPWLLLHSRRVQRWKRWVQTLRRPR